MSKESCEYLEDEKQQNIKKNKKNIDRIIIVGVENVTIKIEKTIFDRRSFHHTTNIKY